MECLEEGRKKGKRAIKRKLNLKKGRREKGLITRTGLLKRPLSFKKLIYLHSVGLVGTGGEVRLLTASKRKKSEEGIKSPGVEFELPWRTIGAYIHIERKKEKKEFLYTDRAERWNPLRKRITLMTIKGIRL